ncbi:hypothetical protein HDU98_008249 [Podochytrium sp. JEL0797]|nr:hypothetical protein HDU98_008249 [Podochytrium sp. JEL0797]
MKSRCEGCQEELDTKRFRTTLSKQLPASPLQSSLLLSVAELTEQVRVLIGLQDQSSIDQLKEIVRICDQNQLCTQISLGAVDGIYEFLFICNGITPADLEDGESGLRFCVTNKDIYVPEGRDRIRHRSCARFKRGELRSNSDFQCLHCSESNRNLNRRIAHSKSAQGMAVKQDPTTPLNLKTLTPRSVKLRLGVIKKQSRKYQRQLDAALADLDRLEEAKVDRNLDSETALEWADIVADVVKAGRGKEALEEMIEAIFKGNSQLFDTESGSSAVEKEEGLDGVKTSSAVLVDAVWGMMEMQGMRLAGKSRSVKINDTIMNIAIELYNSPSTYGRIASVLPLPSKSTVIRYKSLFKVEAGLDLCLVQGARNRVGHSRIIPGQVSDDEMNTKMGVQWESKGNSFCGYVPIAVESLIRGLIKGGSPDEAQLAKKINCFTFTPDAPGPRFIVAYHPNAGNLSSEQLRDELEDVKSDAAPVNVGYLFANSAAGPHSKIPETGWLEPVHISVIHPLDPERRVVVDFCTLPTFKSLRNQLEMSRNRRGSKPPKRIILDENDQRITWDVIVEQLEWDLEMALKDPLMVMATLCPDSVNPDNWTKMNGEFVKKVFSILSNSAVIGRTETTLGFSCELPTPEELKNPSLFFIEESLVPVGLLSHKVAQLERRSHLWPSGQRNPIPTLRIMVIFCELFNSLFLDKERKFTHNNYDRMRLFVAHRLEYFDKLTTKQAERRFNKIPSWEKNGFSAVTIRNLRLCVCALFLTARNALDNNASNPDFTFPVLKGTTSGEEGIFSVARGVGANTVGLFGSMVTGMNAKSTARGFLSSKNKAYSDSEIAAPGGAIAPALPRWDVKARAAADKEVVDGWLNVSGEIPLIALDVTAFDRLTTLEPELGSEFDPAVQAKSIPGEELLSCLMVNQNDKRLADKGTEFFSTFFPRHVRLLLAKGQSLLHVMLDSPSFYQYMILCANTEHARWFQELVSIRDANTASSVETTLWIIIRECYLSVDKFYGQSVQTTGERKSLNGFLGDFFKTHAIAELFRGIDPKFKIAPSLESAIFTCVVDVFKSQLQVFTQMELATVSSKPDPINLDYLNAKSHSIFGWAISKAFIREVAKVRCFDRDSLSHQVAQHKLDALSMLRKFESGLDILEQDEEEYCSHLFRAGNMGYKTLIVRELLPFAGILLGSLWSGVNLKQWGNDAVAFAKDRFSADPKPRAEWARAWTSVFAKHDNLLGDTNLRDSLYDELTNACFNAHTASVLKHERHITLSRWTNKKENLMALRDVLKVASGGKGVGGKSKKRSRSKPNPFDDIVAPLPAVSGPSAPVGIQFPAPATHVDETRDGEPLRKKVRRKPADADPRETSSCDRCAVLFFRASMKMHLAKCSK